MCNLFQKLFMQSCLPILVRRRYVVTFHFIFSSFLDGWIKQKSDQVDRRPSEAV